MQYAARIKDEEPELKKTPGGLKRFGLSDFEAE